MITANLATALQSVLPRALHATRNYTLFYSFVLPRLLRARQRPPQYIRAQARTNSSTSAQTASEEKMRLGKPKRLGRIKQLGKITSRNLKRRNLRRDPRRSDTETIRLLAGAWYTGACRDTPRCRNTMRHLRYSKRCLRNTVVDMRYHRCALRPTPCTAAFATRYRAVTPFATQPHFRAAAGNTCSCIRHALPVASDTHRGNTSRGDTTAATPSPKLRHHRQRCNTIASVAIPKMLLRYPCRRSDAFVDRLDQAPQTQQSSLFWCSLSKQLYKEEILLPVPPFLTVVRRGGPSSGAIIKVVVRRSVSHDACNSIFGSRDITKPLINGV